MKNTFAFNVLLLVKVLVIQNVLSAPDASRLLPKVFTYQGLMPIKDDRQTISKPLNINESNATTSADTSEAEAVCWKLINEQSGRYKTGSFSQKLVNLVNLTS